MTTYATPAELEAGLEHLRETPRGEGVVELIVRRPAVGEREVVDEAELDLVEGLVGDSWMSRGRSAGRPPNPNAQVTVMNARATALVAGDRDRWALAGDQLYVELDLSGDHVPPGTQLQLGSAILEVTDEPHTGCKKFRERFGLEALKFVNSPAGRELNLRGINTRVVQAGTVRTGDAVRTR
jgi:MOSC domain-containing protein YiiM